MPEAKILNKEDLVQFTIPSAGVAGERQARLAIARHLAVRPLASLRRKLHNLAQLEKTHIRKFAKQAGATCKPTGIDQTRHPKITSSIFRSRLSRSKYFLTGRTPLARRMDRKPLL